MSSNLKPQQQRPTNIKYTTTWLAVLAILLAGIVIIVIVTITAFATTTTQETRSSLGPIFDVLNDTAAIYGLVDSFARSVTRQDYEENALLFVSTGTIDYHRAFTFLAPVGGSGANNVLPVSEWVMQMRTFSGGLLSNHLMISNCNFTLSNNDAATIRCIGMYTYSLQLSPLSNETTYPTQYTVFQPIFDAIRQPAIGWKFDRAEALVNATSTWLNGLYTGVEIPPAPSTKKRKEGWSIAYIKSFFYTRTSAEQQTWDTLQFQITALNAANKVDTALGVCKTQQYQTLKAMFDPSSSPLFLCNTMQPSPVIFNSQLMCIDGGGIDSSCLGNLTGSDLAFPDRIRTLNMILPYPSIPATPNSLDFSITGGVGTAVTAQMHGITIHNNGAVYVGLSMPTAEYSVANSPITGGASATLTVTKLHQQPHYFWAGPSVAGPTAQPGFRPIVSADLPLISLTTGVSGILPIARGGTNNGVPLAGNRVMLSSSGGSQIIESGIISTGFFIVGDNSGVPMPGTIIPGTGIDITFTGSAFIISIDGIGITFDPPADLFNDTSTGNIVSFAAIPQIAHTFWAGPSVSGPNAVPFFRQIVVSDLPLINLNTGTTGTLALNRGGTGNNGIFAGERIIMSNTGGSLLLEGTVVGTNGIAVSTGPGAVLTISGAGGTCTPPNYISSTCIPPDLVLDTLQVNYLTVVNVSYIMDTIVRESVITMDLTTMNLVLNGSMTCTPSDGTGIDAGCLPARIRTINGVNPTAAPGLNFNIIAGANIMITPVLNGIVIDAAGGGNSTGSVTSVGLALPASVFSVLGSPVSISGTLTGTLISQSANHFFAAPNLVSGIPVFRGMLITDLPVITDTFIYYASGGAITAQALSLSLAVPSEFSISGSPITSPTGTFTISTATQLANRFWGGPNSGGPAQPTFRSIGYNDFISLAMTNGELLVGSTGGAPVAATLIAGTNIVITNAAGSIKIDAIVPTDMTTLIAGPGISIVVDGSNTTISNTGVTSVGLSLPVSVFSIDISPITTTGTLTASFVSQAARSFFASPTGSVGIPVFRIMALGDLPSLSDGHLYIGNGGTPVAAQLTAGTLMSITPGMGSITIATSALGSVTLNMPTAVFDVASVAGVNTQTLTVTFDTQTANTIFAGPSTGIPAVPAFRILVSADIPSLDTSKLTTGVLPIARGGTNSGTALINGRIMVSSAGAIIEGTSSSTPTFTSATFSATTNQLVLGTTNTITISSITPSSSRTYTLHDAGAAANFVLSVGTAQTITDTATSGEFLVATGPTTSNWRAITSADLPAPTISTTTAISNTTTAAFTGTSYATIDDMTVSLSTGSYYCSFSGVFIPSTSGVTIDIGMFMGASLIPEPSTPRRITGSSSSFNVQSQGIMTAFGTTSLTVKWVRSGGMGGASVTAFDRNLICLKLSA